MSEKRKVTVYLPDALVKKLKTDAIEKDMTLSALVEDIALKQIQKADQKKKTARK